MKLEMVKMFGLENMSNVQRLRVMRRLVKGMPIPAPTAATSERQARLREIQAQISQEIQPALQAKRDTEETVFHIRQHRDTPKPQSKTKVNLAELVEVANKIGWKVIPLPSDCPSWEVWWKTHKK